MKVKAVEFSRLVSYGTFHNVKVGVTVEMDSDESPHLALCQAQSWVHRELARMVGEDALKVHGMKQRELTLDEEQF